MTSKVGRKAKYSTDFVLSKLEEYVAENPNKKIKLSELERVTGIPRHIWRDNGKVKEVIEKVNNMEIVIDTSEMKLILPSAEEIVEKYSGNKKRLLEIITNILELTSSLYEKAVKGERVEEIEGGYEARIRELEYTVKKKELEIKRLNNEIDNLYLDSRDYVKRKQQGIKDNLIELNIKHVKETSKSLKDIKEEFSGLFD